MENNRRVVELPLDDVLPNRFQPRIKFNEDAINELAESIKEHGVIQPIVVRPVGDRYEIIAGERRYKASILAGLTTIPAIITDLNDKDSAEVALIENVQRQDLTPIEEAISYKKILDMGYLKQEELAVKLGKNQSTVANKLRLLNLDEDVQEALLNGKISERHARSLLKLSNREDQIKLLEKIIDERLTVRKTDEEIKNMLNGENKIQDINSDIEILDFDSPVVIPPDEYTANFNIPTTPIMEDVDSSNIVNSANLFDFNPPKQDQPLETEVPNFNDLLFNKPEEDSEIVSGKFFNILDDTEDSKVEQDIKNFDFSPNFGIPTFDDSEFDNNQLSMLSQNIDSQTIEQPKPNSFAVGDIKTVVNTLRECANTIEKYGFIVDTEEFDLENMYQVIFKVHKK